MNDPIERADATETFAELYDIFDDYPNIVKELHKVYDKILAIPSAENKGEWIYPTDIIGFGRCNNCKALWDKSLIDNIYFKYCPRCGARMVKGADDE